MNGRNICCIHIAVFADHNAGFDAKEGSHAFEIKYLRETSLLKSVVLLSSCDSASWHNKSNGSVWLEIHVTAMFKKERCKFHLCIELHFMGSKQFIFTRQLFNFPLIHLILNIAIGNPGRIPCNYVEFFVT